MKSYNKPTSEQIDKVIPALSSPQHEAYFFAHLKNPLWIGPLAERDIFKYPPNAEHVKGGGIRFPRWPPGSYLARMASQAPAEVAAILAAIETDNAFVIGDILDAALAMPAGVATSLVSVISKGAREGALWIGFKDASDLCLQLAESGLVDAAMELAEALFTPAFEVGQDEPKRRDVYWYKDGLKKVTPVLAVVNASEFLPKLGDWLRAAIEAKKNADSDSGTDYSEIWRPAIEEHEQNLDYDFAAAIVQYVRDGFERAIRHKSVSLDEALRILEGYNYLIFKRLRLHLIGEFAEENVDLARRAMLDLELFDARGCKHEHARLLGRRFPLLTSAEQEEWLAWVRSGPQGELAQVIADSYEPERAERRRLYWRFERLHWVREHLVGEDRDFYQQMLAEYGEPEMADLISRVRPPRLGPESPMTADQLRQRTFEEAVEAVSSWEPKERDFMAPDIEGLASTFEQYVASDSTQFSAKAQVLMNRPAPFVRKFISQMSKAVGTETEIDLSAVLGLCDWVLSRSVDERTVPEQEDGALTDKDWQWTRDEVSRFVETICQAKSGEMPKYPLNGLKERMWELIKELCHDRPEPHDERDDFQGDVRIRDYLNFAINTPRGKAVETALEYARWVANHIKKTDGKNEVIPRGFDAMPEVREMLEWQIAKENRTVEAMAVVGSRINLIYWIDKQWLADSASRLFPLAEMKQVPYSPDAWAAWNAFLVWGRIYIELYRTFKAQFAHAVDQVADFESTGGRREEPMRRLGEYLMLLCGWGELTVDDEDGLLRRFIENASPDLRCHTISFVGQSLDQSEDVPEKVIQRFMALWEHYWAGLGKKDAAEKPDAWLFSWWFSCGRFPEQWALDQLEQFIEVAPTPEPDHAIAEKLAEIADVDISKSVRILDRMVRGDQEGWRIHSSVEPAKKILQQAMKASGEAKEQAVVLINYLGRRGYTEFGQLLHE